LWKILFWNNTVKVKKSDYSYLSFFAAHAQISAFIIIIRAPPVWLLSLFPEIFYP